MVCTDDPLLEQCGGSEFVSSKKLATGLISMTIVIVGFFLLAQNASATWFAAANADTGAVSGMTTTVCAAQNALYKSMTASRSESMPSSLLLRNQLERTICAIDEEVENVKSSNIAQEQLIREILTGHPMAEMAPELAAQDPLVASFLVGIAKQESNWGKRSPSKDGVDCYNYWGYKTSGSRGKALGHACFGSRAEAVQTVGKRVSYFVIDQNRTTARKLLVWKCGRSCATHNPAGVERWVNVIDRYRKLLPVSS